MKDEPRLLQFLVVTQTRVREGMSEEFARWQAAISAAVAEFPGFITQSVLPPNPPVQTDWVIQQRFAERRSRLGLAALRAADRIAGRSSVDVGGAR